MGEFRVTARADAQPGAALLDTLGAITKPSQYIASYPPRIKTFLYVGRHRLRGE